MLPIYLCGDKIGYAERTSSGLKAACPMESGYIYRLELIGKTNLSLGVMIPKDNRFVLEKHGDFFENDWKYAEISRCKVGDSVAFPLPFALSHGSSAVSLDFVTDKLLKDCLSLQKSVFTAVFHGTRFVYFPFDTSCQSSMAPFFFCLTVFDTPRGLFAAFCIDENNLPISLI